MHNSTQFCVLAIFLCLHSKIWISLQYSNLIKAGLKKLLACKQLCAYLYTAINDNLAINIQSHHRVIRHFTDIDTLLA